MRLVGLFKTGIWEGIGVYRVCTLGCLDVGTIYLLCNT